MRQALITSLTNMTEAEAQRVYNALSQWADNQRGTIQETDAREDGYAEMAADLLAVQKLEEAGSEALASLAEGKVVDASPEDAYGIARDARDAAVAAFEAAEKKYLAEALPVDEVQLRYEDRQNEDQ